jgi:hypothetical protein
VALSDPADTLDKPAAPMAQEEFDALEESLSGLVGGYLSRTRTLAGAVQGLLGAPEGSVRTPQIAAAGGLPEHALRRVLDEVELDEAALRRALICGLPAQELRALAIETAWIEIAPGERGKWRQILSLQAHGEERAVPIGWAVLDVPPPPGRVVPGVVELEIEAIAALVAQAGRDYQALAGSTFGAAASVPVVVWDPAYGPDQALRRALGRLVTEYWIGMDGSDVLEGPLEQEPYEPLGIPPAIGELFAPVPAASIPEPREILAGPARHGREYLTAGRRDGVVHFGIARPFVASEPGAAARQGADRARPCASRDARGRAPTADRPAPSDAHRDAAPGPRGVDP